MCFSEIPQGGKFVGTHWKQAVQTNSLVPYFLDSPFPHSGNPLQHSKECSSSLDVSA